MRRLTILGILIYVLVILGLAALSSRLLALAIPAVLYLTVAVAWAPEPLQLKVTRTLSTDHTLAGMPVAVRLAVTNQGTSIECCAVEDVVPLGLQVVEGKPRIAAALRPGATLECSYTVGPGRGLFDFEGVHVSASDLLGLAERQEFLQAPGHLTVLPEPFRLKRVGIRPLRTRGHAGPVPARQGGSGIDFFGVREYQPGDPRRWINWRASARHPATLYTNEFQQERIADVGLMLDARSRHDVRVSGHSLFEHSIRATASLADVFLRDGNRVGLLVFGQYLDWTFPGYGKVQRERILRALARARPGESQVFDSLENVPTRFFPAQSQLVLVSPLSQDDLPVLLRLRARGYQLLVIRPDPVSFEVLGLQPSRPAKLAERILHAERALVRRGLQQAGVQLVDWHVDRPFDQVLHGSLGRVPQWFRAVKVQA
jgi:uncharacterized protein (DUF58 family)